MEEGAREWMAMQRGGESKHRERGGSTRCLVGGLLNCSGSVGMQRSTLRQMHIGLLRIAGTERECISWGLVSEDSECDDMYN